MSEYVPTTERVRTAYAGGWAPESIPGGNAYAEFDRWLAQHDAEVRATALEEAAVDPSLRLSGHSGVSITKLRTRAARIREEGRA